MPEVPSFTPDETNPTPDSTPPEGEDLTQEQIDSIIESLFDVPPYWDEPDIEEEAPVKPAITTLGDEKNDDELNIRNIDLTLKAAFDIEIKDADEINQVAANLEDLFEKIGPKIWKDTEFATNFMQVLDHRLQPLQENNKNFATDPRVNTVARFATSNIEEILNYVEECALIHTMEPGPDNIILLDGIPRYMHTPYRRFAAKDFLNVANIPFKTLDNSSKKAVAQALNNKPHFVQKVRESDLVYKLAPYYAHEARGYPTNPENQENKEAAKRIRDYLDDDAQEEDSRALFLREAFSLNSSETDATINLILHELFNAYGVDTVQKEGDQEGELIKALRKAAPSASKQIISMHNSYEEAIIRSLDTLKLLAEEHKDAPKVLQERFKIQNFGRYPLEVLIDQFENIDNVDTPYGVAIYPRHDHNGTFYDDLGYIKDLHEQLDGKALMRIVECASRFEIARRLKELDRTYGGANRIGFLIVAGHGNGEKIYFGDDDQKGGNSLSIEDVRNSQADKVIPMFEENSPILLLSCFAGTNEGIGQELSIISSTSVNAPKQDAYGIKEISPRFDENGKIVGFDVNYIESETTEFNKGISSSS